MTARIIDGTAIARRIRDGFAPATETFRAAAGRVPGLVVVLVGNNPASLAYVRSKRKACLELGWHSEIVQLADDAPQEVVAETIARLNADTATDGILLQLPLPAHLDEQYLLEAIEPAKDVDGFHPVNVGRLVLGLPGPAPCTPLGVQRLLLEEKIPTAGQFAVVIGRSNIVGKPMAQLLARRGPGGDATVCLAHSRTRDLRSLVAEADIVIAAIGQPAFVRGEWIKPGAAVIDVGINRVEDAGSPRGYRLAGDVEFESARERAAAITPVPGGVGPMTIAMLLANTLDCARRRVGLAP